ncbi:uncharacterized protein EKO05_0002644 [Ascochyta rabiei]|uniref:uncharacterized protein n=1 Tax=Didymella rabiei TaxID=5454 RepID=UPI0019019801|nr:uncharacterized protein EKO05_0002644 [Ascochyta rabiei]UPX12068.1 hypothetical protein EKO05_0002644 [Ascochyta rabiei]
MPTHNVLFWVTLPVLVGMVLYQIGLQSFLPASIQKYTGFKIFRSLFEETYCYASIKTLSSDLDQAECFSISNGKFSRVFNDDFIKQDSSYDAVKDARAGYVYPGFWDGHGHLIQLGELLNSVSLFGAESMAEVQDRLVQYKASHPEEGTSKRWLRGVGWDQAKFNGKWPTTSDLEINEAFKDQYVMLDRVDVHCIWVSNMILDLLPSPLPEVPAGGEIVATGIFCDNAMDMVLEYYPKPGKDRKSKFVKDAMSELNKLGIVGMHDAGVIPGDLKLYERLSTDEDWTVRVNAMIECDARNTFCPHDVKKISTTNGMFHVRSVKLFGDGALGSWGSAMIDPYSDKESSIGSLLVNATVLSSLTQNWAAEGYQVNIHAIGDRANRLAIDAFEITLKLQCPEITRLKECQQQQHRFRIEHAQIIHPDDQRRMFELGIIPSIQPTHATSDMGYAESRLGKQRTADEAYRMRSLLSLGPVLGSDFPVEPASIFEGMYAATTRRSPLTGLDPSGGKTGWYPDETLTVEDALKGFTINPAYGAFLEGNAGVIQEGAWADWVVLDEPLEGMDLEDLRKVTVRETWIGGKMVYQRPGH